MPRPHFDHEKLSVYAASIAFLGLSSKIVMDLPRGYGPVSDQLMRAATSISLNIAEGAGEYSGKEKARFYRMARRSATECAAILDVLRELEASEASLLVAGREQLLGIVAMLVGLVRALAARD